VTSIPIVNALADNQSVESETVVVPIQSRNLVGMT
jgi:hypothetical protein